MKILPLADQTNTILYCAKWSETVAFYANTLKLPVTWNSSWMVEFMVSETGRISIADASRTTIKSVAGEGITLTFKVKDIAAVWNSLTQAGIQATAISRHPLQARVFYFSDPEGHRIEIWSPTE